MYRLCGLYSVAIIALNMICHLATICISNDTEDKTKSFVSLILTMPTIYFIYKALLNINNYTL